MPVHPEGGRGRLPLTAVGDELVGGAQQVSRMSVNRGIQRGEHRSGDGRERVAGLGAEQEVEDSEVGEVDDLAGV